MSDKQNELENWDSLAGDWLKADLVEENPWKMPVTGSQIEKNRDGKNQLVLVVEYRGREWLFGINRTNQNFLMDANVTPMTIRGKMLHGSKMKVNNPKTGKPQDSLVIESIE